MGLVRRRLLTAPAVSGVAAGLSITRYNQLLAVLTAVVVVGAMQIMGVILVAAMLVIPNAAATPIRGSSALSRAQSAPSWSRRSRV